MYMITGAAGFVGSSIIRALNQQGHTDIIAVDDLTDGHKCANLADCIIADYIDKDFLFAGLLEQHISLPVTAISHQGACTDTMEYDGQFMMENNYTFSKLLLDYATTRQIPFVYASSAATYGNSTTFVESPENEQPINVYGYSKLAFDQHVRHRLNGLASTVVGLRYFNVYGVREHFKGRMASMVYQLYHQLTEHGACALFAGTDGYGDGDQRRDFICVNDVVRVNMHFLQQGMDGNTCKGVYNCGTGTSRSFNDVANTLISLLGNGRIEYIPFNETLKGKYQSFTEADLTNLRQAGYNETFMSLEEGIAACVDAWNQ